MAQHFNAELVRKAKRRAPGSFENSPALQCWVSVTKHEQVRQDERSVLPSLSGLISISQHFFPALKRWAIVEEMAHHSSPKSQKRSSVSAGLLMFRRKKIDPPPDGFAVANSIEFLLVHPGGPFWKNKDDRAWSIPKGQVEPGEDFLCRAQIEFEEETGLKPQGDWISLGSIKQKGGKTVHGWAFEGDLPENFELKSNTFEIEWPPRSGKFSKFPEVDRAEFFSNEIARRKMNPAQIPFLDRLRTILAVN